MSTNLSPIKSYPIIFKENFPTRLVIDPKKVNFLFLHLLIEPDIIDAKEQEAYQ